MQAPVISCGYLPMVFILGLTYVKITLVAEI